MVGELRRLIVEEAARRKVSLGWGALHALGLGGDAAFFSAASLGGLGVSTLLGTSMEYAWDRYISESLRKKMEADPKNRFRHLMVADAQAATTYVDPATGRRHSAMWLVPRSTDDLAARRLGVPLARMLGGTAPGASGYVRRSMPTTFDQPMDNDSGDGGRARLPVPTGCTALLVESGRERGVQALGRHPLPIFDR